MIDRIYVIVLALLKKENRGWLKPDDYNRFADMTQLEIFEEYFSEYNRWLRLADRNQVHTGYADMPEKIAEKIDRFLTEGSLTWDAGSASFTPPSNLYRVETVIYNGTTLVEPVKDRRTLMLLGSDGIAPTTTYPVFMRLGQNFKVYPTTITSNMSCQYLRRPATPQWTYLELSGNPVFDPTNNDYQDFEIHPSDEYKLVHGILSKAGLSIREAEVVQYIEAEQQVDMQKRNS